jgi:hypothetical protein
MSWASSTFVLNVDRRHEAKLSPCLPVAVKFKNMNCVHIHTHTRTLFMYACFISIKMDSDYFPKQY